MSFFGNLFNNDRKQPEDYYESTVTPDFVKVEHPKFGTSQILWKDVRAIKLINTDEGPVLPDIWLALIGENSSCLIPHGSPGFDKVYDIVSRYENFDFENVTKSMSSTDNAEFLLWKRAE